ncbi:MAG TPA: cache domain-containing protein [Fibrobacteria bacterium]|nr:cache domain-containing protein [Fibrobacteria bacterium]
MAGIRVRILALLLLALLPALGLMLYLAREHRNQITQDVNENALRLCRFLAASLERDIQAARSFLNALSQPTPGSGSIPANCPDFLTSLDINAEMYDAVGLADASGKILCQVPATSGPGRLDSSEWFRAARASGRFSMGYDLDHTVIDKATMDFGFPVRDSAGAVKAVFFCALDLEWLNRLAERLELPEGAALTVTDRGGRTLVRYPHPELWVGRSFPDAPLSRSVLARSEGVVESPGIEGVVRLYAFSSVDSGELSVRLGIPRETAYADAQAAMVRSLVALGAVGVLAMLAAWAAGNWMVVRQTQRLVAAAKSLASGNLGTRTGMEHHAGEFGQLARAFDEMAESLQWREAQLRESESERSQSEGRFSEIVDRAPDAILGVDGDLSLFFCNQGAEQMFGWPREEMEGMDLGRLEKTGTGAPAETLAGALRDAARERMEASLVRRDGSPFRADVSVSRAERNGRIIYTLILRETDA